MLTLKETVPLQVYALICQNSSVSKRCRWNGKPCRPWSNRSSLNRVYSACNSVCLFSTLNRVYTACNSVCLFSSLNWVYTACNSVCPFSSLNRVDTACNWSASWAVWTLSASLAVWTGSTQLATLSASFRCSYISIWQIPFCLNFRIITSFWMSGFLL